MTSTDSALVARWGGSLDPHPQTRVPNDLPTTEIVSIAANTPLHSGEDCIWSNKGGVFSSTPPPPVLHCLPHNRTADALASTGALYRKDRLGIFRFGNLRTRGCDWLLWPHDNLGRKCSCVLSPSVSLEGSWGVFGGLGRPLSFNITGKQRNGEKLTISHLYTLAWLLICRTSHPLLPFGSVRTADWGISGLKAASGIIPDQNCLWMHLKFQQQFGRFVLFFFSLHVVLLFTWISAPALPLLSFIRGPTSCLLVLFRENILF